MNEKFVRNEYYSITDVVNKYRVTSGEYKELIRGLPKVERVTDMGTYKVQSVYVLRELVAELNLPLRHKN